MDDKKGKSGPVTDEQKEKMFSFLKVNEKLLKNKFEGNFTHKNAEEKWKELADILNSSSGPKKDWKSWRKTWQDLRSRTKTKNAKIKSHAQGTGGGPLDNTTLTKSEVEILNLVSTVSIEGDPTVEESVTDFEFENPPIFEEQEDTNHFDSNQNGNTVETDVATSSKENKSPNTPLSTKIIRNRKSRLQHTVAASNSLAKNIAERNAIKKKYFEDKLKLYERKVIAIEKISESLQELADSIC